MTGYQRNPEPDDDDDRVDRRAEELAGEWIADSDKVRAAIAECLSNDDDDLIALDLASAFVAWELAPADVKPDDIVGRFHDLMRAMRPRILAQLNDDALQQATTESRDWPRWRGTMEATRFQARSEP